MGTHLIREGLSNSKALQCAWWQAAAFRLPLAQHEASGWWDASPTFSGLCLIDFLFHTDASGPRYFWAVRQEKTLALAQALWACAKELGVPTGILCESAWELQSARPLMTHSGDDFVEVSLLKPMRWTQHTPTQEEEAALLGEEIKLPQVPGSPPRQLEIHRFVEPADRSTAPSASSPSPTPQPSCLPSRKAKKSQ